MRKHNLAVGVILLAVMPAAERALPVPAAVQDTSCPHEVCRALPASRSLSVGALPEAFSRGDFGPDTSLDMPPDNRVSDTAECDDVDAISRQGSGANEGPGANFKSTALHSAASNGHAGCCDELVKAPEPMRTLNTQAAGLLRRRRPREGCACLGRIRHGCVFRPLRISLRGGRSKRGGKRVKAALAASGGKTAAAARFPVRSWEGGKPAPLAAAPGWSKAGDGAGGGAGGGRPGERKTSVHLALRDRAAVAAAERGREVGKQKKKLSKRQLANAARMRHRGSFVEQVMPECTPRHRQTPVRGRAGRARTLTHTRRQVADARHAPLRHRYMHIQVMREIAPEALGRNPYKDFIQYWSGHTHQDDMHSGR